MSDEDFVAAQAGSSPCVEYVPKPEVNKAFTRGFFSGIFVTTIAFLFILTVVL